MENIELYKKYWPTDMEYDNEYSKKNLSQFVLESPYFDATSKSLNYYGKVITVGEFHKKREEAAIAFKNMGIKEGDIVFAFMLNTPELFYSFYALNDIGAVSEWFNPKGMTPALIRKYINENNIKHIIVSDVLYGLMREAMKGTNVEKVIVNSLRDSFGFITDLKYMTMLLGSNTILQSRQAKKILTREEAEKESLIQKKLRELETYSIDQRFNAKLLYHIDKNIDSKFISWPDFIRTYYRNEKLHMLSYEDDRTSVIVHTGGTTGPIKRIAVTDSNINSFIYKLRHMPFDLKPGDTHLHLIPPLAGWSFSGIHVSRYYNMLSHIIASYDKAEFVDIMLKTRANHYFTVPAFVKTVIDNPKLEGKDLSFIKTMNHGGEAWTAEEDKKTDETLKEHGCEVTTNYGYGLNEVFGGVINNIKFDGDEKKYGCCGIPLPGTEYLIVDPKTNEILPFGKNKNDKYNIGEICIAGDQLMQGYIGEDECLNEQVFININGKRFFKTGDQGWGDEDGKLWFFTREARIIRTQDGKVFATLLENIINRFEEIKECCVVAISDEKVSKRPSCHIVLQDSYYKLSDEELLEVFEKLVKKIDAATEELYTFYEIATYELHYDSLPSTAFGKTDYRKLEADDNEEYEKTNKNVARLRFKYPQKNRQ